MKSSGGLVPRRHGPLEGLDIVVWAVVATLALVGEILTVSFFLLFFSLGALFALLIAFLGFGVGLQIGGFVAASVLSMVVLRPALLHRISLYLGFGRSQCGQHGRDRPVSPWSYGFAKTVRKHTSSRPLFSGEPEWLPGPLFQLC